MRILQLSKYYPPTHGGLELVAEFFSRACGDLGHSVDIISLGETRANYQGRFGENVFQEREDIKLNSSPLSWGYFQRVKEILVQNRPDYIFVHLPNPFSHEVCKWLAKDILQSGAKVIGIYHSDIVNQVLLKDAYNLHFKRHLDLYDGFICASPNLRDSSDILSNLSKDKVHVIPFCVDHPYQGKIKKESHQFQGKFLTIGRMVPYKGYEFLINAFKSLPYELTIVGNGPLKEKLKAMAGPNIKFVGGISEEEKFKLLVEHDALIMSSINRAEAFGMTIVEAFSVGLPVIASDIDTGVSYLVRDDVTGFKFPIKNEMLLQEKIRQFSQNKGQAEKISARCLQFFQEDLNYPSFREKLSKLLKREAATSV